MPNKKIEFVRSRGVGLTVRLELPSVHAGASALFAQCFAGGKDRAAAALVSRALTKFDIAVLRVDLTGLDGSGGDFGHIDFTANIEDLAFAADYPRETFTTPSIRTRHSLGGAAMLAAKYRVPEVRAVATTGAPTDPDLTTVGLRRAGPTARLSGRHGTDTPSRRRFIDGDVARGTGSAE
ncbi:MAG: hypothetical protein J2P19_10010 [Pseudonocardia sp.]|nr:hypothetical protein [Pseudonocardia sp.]